MAYHPNILKLLADIRCRELAGEAERLRLLREAHGDSPSVRAALATARAQLDELIIRARQLRELVRWTPALLRRSAITR